MSTIDKKYIDLCRDILANGSEKGDRTGTGTISVFGRTLRHDLSEGFPILTTKSVHFKSVVGEILWFLRGDTNIEFLQDHKIKIWDGFANKDGGIGALYPESWRRWYAPTGDIAKVAVRGDSDADFLYPFNDIYHPPIDCDLNTKECWAIENLGASSGNTRYKIQFSSGFVTETSRPNWRGSADVSNFDAYKKTVFGVGFLGNYRVWDEKTHTLWYNMMARCYNPKHPTYKWYGGLGVKVSPIWHSYEFFYESLHRLIGFNQWKGGADLQIDKDYFGSSIYSPSTCIFLPPSHNLGMRGDGSLVEICGERYLSIMDWASGNSKNAWYANSRWKKGLSYKNIQADDVRVVYPDTGYLWRRKVYHDQIANLISGIKNTPNSRRLLVSAWNPADLPDESMSPVDNVDNGKPALGACHYSFQCYVDDGKLSLIFNMRSSDVFLGLPFNLASYALLCHMLAQVCGLEVGELIWSGADVHIYKNHIEQVKTQIERYDNGEVFETPTLVLNKDITDIDDFTFDDIQLISYKNAGKLTGEVAV